MTVFCACELFLLVLASHCFLETEVVDSCPQQVLALPLPSDALRLPDITGFTAPVISYKGIVHML